MASCPAEVAFSLRALDQPDWLLQQYTYLVFCADPKLIGIGSADVPLDHVDATRPVLSGLCRTVRGWWRQKRRISDGRTSNSFRKRTQIVLEIFAKHDPQTVLTRATDSLPL